MTFLDIEIEWPGGETNSHRVMSNATYGQTLLSPGRFKFTLPTDGGEDYLIDSITNILHNGRRMFRGKIQNKAFDLNNDTITYTGTDMFGMMGIRKISYEFRTATEPSSAIDTLFGVYWRDQDGNNYFDTTDLTASDFTTFQMDFSNTPFNRAIKQIAESSYIGDNYGFGFWIDEWDVAHFEPLGYEKLNLQNPVTKENFNRSGKELVTSVIYRGRQGAHMPPDRDGWTEYATDADVNNWWNSTNCALTSEKFPVRATLFSMGVNVVAQNIWWLDLDMTGSATDTVDLTKADFFKFWMRYESSQNWTNVASNISVALVAGDGTTVKGTFILLLGNGVTCDYYRGYPSAVDTWGYCICDFTDWTSGGTDLDDLRYIRFHFNPGGADEPWSGVIYIDGVHFERTPITGQYPTVSSSYPYGTSTQIDQYGLRQLRLIDGLLWDQTACDRIAQNLYEKLSTPLHNGSLTVSGIVDDPLAKYVTRDIRGAMFDLYVNSYNVTLSNGKAVTQFKLGQSDATWEEYLASIGRKAKEAKAGELSFEEKLWSNVGGGSIIPESGDPSSYLGCTDGYMDACKDSCTTGAGDESGTEGGYGSFGKGYDPCFDACMAWTQQGTKGNAKKY